MGGLLRMANRRDVLRCAALTALPLTLGLANLAEAGIPARGSGSGVGTVVVDSRFAPARDLGAQLARAGAQVHALADADVTAVWRDTLAPAWSRGPVAVAGLTTSSSLFVLEQLAWPHGLRVVFHAEHYLASDGTATHQLLRCTGVGPTLSTKTLDFLGRMWPGRVASVISSWDERPRIGRVGPSCAGLAPELPPGVELLTSWIIAAA